MNRLNYGRLKQWILTLIIIFITLELSPYLFGKLILHQTFSRKDTRTELKNVDIKTDHSDTIQTDNSAGYLGDHILHPYLGFVSIPQSNFNEFNLPGINPLTKKSSDKLNVVIMGGSVAKDIYTYTGERIKHRLKTFEPFADKEINLVVFALGGFKQPQQLIALNYFMALGAEYDLVINIDGFNEIVLPYADNLPHHVFPSYPRHWNIYSRKKIDSKVMLIIGKQSVLEEERKHSMNFMAKSPWRYSNFGLFIWKITDLKKKTEFAKLETLLRATIENSHQDYQSTGIFTTMTDTVSFFQEQAELWRRSSEQIAGIAKSSEFDYFHFLQPNQYVSGSKPFTDEELQMAYESGPFAYKDAVMIGYSILTKEGRIMIEKGMNFTDLTLMFKDERRTVYNDKCCHFNQLGYDLIADRICDEIILKSSNN